MTSVHPFQREDEFENETFTDLTWTERTLDDKGFYLCTFVNVDFSQSTLRHCTFDGCTFVNGNLSLSKLYNTTWRDVTFEGTKLMGVDWTLARRLTFSVVFERCVLSYSSFLGLRLKRTPFRECVLEEVDFTEADLTDASFPGSRLSGSTFVDTNLTRADLSEATDYAIDPRRNTLTETQFSLDAALRVAAQFGILVPSVEAAEKP